MRRFGNRRPEGAEIGRGAVLWSVALLAMLSVAARAQAAPQQNAAAAPAATAPAPQANHARPPTQSERRRATKLYLAASKLYVNGQFEAALKNYEEAARLDPTNNDYRLAADVARSHAVTALIQSAAKDRLGGNAAGARAALSRALALDPANPEITQHLYELSDDALSRQTRPLYEQAASTLGEIEPLLSAPGLRSFHVRNDQRQVIQQVFKAFGVDAMLDESVRPTPVRFELDDVDFATATRLLGLATDTFYVPLDSHRVLAARDTRENRQQFMREQLETIYLAGLTDTELTDVGNLAKNVFNIQQVASDPANSSITLRAEPSILDNFNASMRSLLEGHDQVMLDVRLIQVARANGRNTGAQLPQTFTAFNLYAEEQSILNANKDLVAQIISSGLASPNDPIAIILLLAAAGGSIPSNLLTGGFALFGGGLTQSALSPGPASFNFNLNSSESRAIDNLQLRLGDGEASTIKEGTRYPIQTASYSSLGPNIPNIPGLTGAGNSSNLSSLLGALGGAGPNIPMIQYQDLGLNLKVTPKVLRSGSVALTVEMKIDALSGSSVNGNPILNTQSYSAVITLKEGETAEIASNLDQSESRAISGTPGLSEIPGLNDVSDKTVQKNYATLLVVMTPHLVRATQAAGHTPQMIVEKGATTR